jgi:hypothetical protein
MLPSEQPVPVTGQEGIRKEQSIQTDEAKEGTELWHGFASRSTGRSSDLKIGVQHLDIPVSILRTSGEGCEGIDCNSLPELNPLFPW